jgi:hypothetical protein
MEVPEILFGKEKSLKILNFVKVFFIVEHKRTIMLPASAGFLLCLVFNPEDGSDMSLKNVRLSLNCMILQPRRL